MRKMLSFRLWLLVTLLTIFGAVHCTNILEEFADKTSDEALKAQAVLEINNGDYNAALAQFALMSPTFLAKREVKILRASAYAGLCGMDFLSFLTAIQSYTGNLFAFLMLTYKAGTAAQATACENAEADVKSISTSAASRTENENVFMALLSLIKIGKVLAANTTVDADDDGAVDVGFDECDTLQLTDTEVGEIGVSFVAAANSLAATSVAPSLSTSLGAICTAIPGLCSVTNPASFTGLQLKALRGIVSETTDGIGIGSCVNDIVTCTCP